LSESKSEAAARLRTHLEAATRLRAAAMADRRRRDAALALRRWQSGRLARTYPDLLAHPRYRGPALFFFDELYGPKDLSGRDRDVQRILPTMTRLLPAAALSTIADAIELDALSESLDAALLAALDAQGGDAAKLTEPAYAGAYRACANRPERERQIAFVETIGTELEALTRIPLLEGTIRLMGAPARAAGLSGLHNFLATGFSTFKKMGDAGEFLGTIAGRETLLMKRLFDGTPDPFAGLAPAAS
jgi:hypothetical protein